MNNFGIVVCFYLAFICNFSRPLAADRWTEFPQPPAMPMAVRSGAAPVNGIEMYYAIYGSAAGTPILLIHGGLGYADIWANQVADLSREHTVIVADSRGHGRSTRTSAPYAYDLMASDYVALLDYLKVGQVALVGWSDGGIIGLDIAMKHPERLTKLFAHAANTKTDGFKHGFDKTMTWLAYVEHCKDVYKRISPTHDEYDAFLTEMNAMWTSQPNWSDGELKTINVPTAIVIGDHDEAIDRGHTEYIAQTVPGAKLVILEKVSHFALLQDPQGYTAAIRAFLEAPE
ncbi:alpha/beta fold hydrolase [Sinorhizobium fredii]|uniref:alpha/beta fold hydrolase n=1 Tax=Rhizobium fredii TaxID=380 RepID=UPI0005956726|nr:alpha/beta fold hydrolase [Sinorhizobium fredii]WOS64094.1 alpha/beta fold hydrolase [Sinorhizobium fredii GR64]